MMLAVLELVAYDDAWKQFIDDADKLSGNQQDLISEVRYWKRDLWPDKEPA